MTTTGQPAIETQALRKLYGPQVAVQGLSLTVGRGEIFGFLGPNGAGKSTSIKMLLGLVHPTSGNASVLGEPVSSVEVRRQLGFLPEDFRFYDWLTAEELIRFHGRLAGMSPAKLRTRAPEVLEMVGLGPQRGQRLRGFSKGMLQRVGLAQAMVHEPQILFLDEPTSGLDPIGRRLVRDILRAERDRGATVFLNSHFLSEIEITCDRVVFLKGGEVVATRDLRTAPGNEVRVVVRAKNVSAEAAQGLTPWLENFDPASERMVLRVASQDALPGILRHLVSSGADVFTFAPERLSLEDQFVEIMGGDSGG